MKNYKADCYNPETYSIPIYENGIKTELEMTPDKKLPNLVNVNLKQNKDE